jgi:spore germination cell wall hydrolase CwlJ-like protein
MTTTHCANDRTKPVAEKPTFSYLSCRGTSTQEHDIVPLEDVEPMPEPLYTDAELEVLALAIYQEAGSDACSDETRYMVGAVILNRVASDRFPDTLEEVLLQERQYGRLCWTGLVWPERASKPGEAHAVERAYRQARELLDGTVTDVLPSDVVFQAEFVQGTEVVAESDGFYFCR